MTQPSFTHLHASACPVYRIAAGETNKFVMLVDPLVEQTGFIQVLEIFDVGGFTPPNQHRAAEEVFVVLCGQGQAMLGKDTLNIQPGSVLLLRPGHSHAVRNTGNTRLYCLTTMVPDEDFAKLITSGVPDVLDAQDLVALGWGA
jgi:mannose-6-phosphate isomerase-like protein (cupin superfamily)